MTELPAALVLLAFLVVGAVASLWTERGRRAAVLLSERPATWIMPVVLAMFLAYLVRRLALELNLVPDQAGVTLVRRNLAIGTLSLVESVLPTAVLAGHLGWVRQAVEERPITPEGFWQGVRSNFPALLLVTILFSVLGMILEPLPGLIAYSLRLPIGAAIALAVLFANVEVFQLATLLGDRPAPADLFARIERIPRKARWDSAIPVAFHLLGLGILTLYASPLSLAEIEAGRTAGDLALGFHSMSVFNYGVAAHWFADLTIADSTYNWGRVILRHFLGGVVGMYSVLMLAGYMQLPVPSTLPAGSAPPSPDPAPPLPGKAGAEPPGPPLGSPAESPPAACPPDAGTPVPQAPLPAVLASATLDPASAPGAFLTPAAAAVDASAPAPAAPVPDDEEHEKKRRRKRRHKR